MVDNAQQLLKACKLALDGDWHGAHHIAQDYSGSTANWIHAVLHKIEGDKWNSQYWYARTSTNHAHGKKYEDFSDAREELMVIAQTLS